MDLDHLMLRVLVFVDRNGTVVSKSSTPMSSTLQMKYKDDKMDITMHAYAHGMGNGSCDAKVKYQGKVVFNASGCFTARPYDVEAKTYVSGSWETLIPEVK